MALEFLGGLAGAFNAIQKGVDDDKQRQWVDETRENERGEREYRRGLRTREQIAYDRKEALRSANAGLTVDGEDPQTPEIKPAPAITPPANPQAKQAPDTNAPADGGLAPGLTPEKTPSTPAAPAALAAPATPAAPAASATTQTMPGATPAAATEQPKKRMTYGEYLRRTAENERKYGEPGKYLELRQAADKWDLDQAGRRLNQLMGQADTMSLEEYATHASRLFNADPLPQQVTGMSKDEKTGAVTLTIRDKDTGQSTQRTFKSTSELTSALQSFYQPETFAKLQAAAAESRLKLRDELLKPRVLKPGESFVALNPVSRKFETLAEGNIPKGYEPVITPNGDTVLRPIPRDGAGGAGAGTDTGKGGKATDPASSAGDMFQDAATKGEVKLQPAQLAQGNRMAQDIARRGVDPSLAANIAMEVALDPKKARLEFNFTTGEVEQIFQDPRVNRGNPVVISSGAGTIQEIEQQAGGPKAMRGHVVKMVDRMYENLPAERREAARNKLIQIAADPELTKSYLEAAAEAGKDVNVIKRQLDLVKTYVQPEQKTEPTPRNSGGYGLNGGTEYTPPPGSPAAQAAERRDAARRERETKDAQAAEQRRIKTEAATAKVKNVIASGDIVQAAAFQDSDDFQYLSQQDKTAIYKIVNGIK